MLKSQKLAIAASVAVVFSGQSFAIVDGWDFSGSSARNEAMNLDYWNSHDNYNVWVNPAYATKYTDYVDINITDGSRDDEMAGVFYETASAGTWGFYIGRPAAPTDIDEEPVGAPFIEPPRSQFDLFGAFSGGSAGEFGFRLNVQLLEGDENNAPTTVITPNTPQATDATFTSNTEASSNSFDSSDFNLSLGWVSNSGQFDAALLIGSPTRSGSEALSSKDINEALNGIDRTVTARTIDTSSSTGSVDDDGQQNLGLVFRADFGILTTLSYAKRDYSMKSASSDVTTNFTDLDVTDGIVNNDSTTTTTTNGAFDGESTEIRLVGSQVFPVTATSNIFGSLGIASFESETTGVTTLVANSTTDNLTGDTIYNSTLGTQSDLYRKSTRFEIPLVVSAEGKVSDSFTIRGSIIKNLYETEEFEETKRTYAAPTTLDAADPLTATQNILVQTESSKITRTWDTDTTIALGLGYTKASFTLDLVILKEFVTQGIDDPLTSRINGTWKF